MRSAHRRHPSTRTSPSATLVQSTSLTKGTAGTSQAISLDTPATAGNLLVAFVGIDKNSGAITLPTDFSLVAKNEDAVEVDAAYAMAYKVATGGETGVTWAWVQSRVAALAITEWSGLHASPLDVTAQATSASTSTATQSSGTTAATSQANELAIAAFVADSWGTAETSHSYTNGFTELEVEPTAPDPTGTLVGMWVVYKVLDAVGTVETTITRVGATSDQMRGMVATFKVA